MIPTTTLVLVGLTALCLLFYLRRRDRRLTRGGRAARERIRRAVVISRQDLW